MPKISGAAAPSGVFPPPGVYPSGTAGVASPTGGVHRNSSYNSNTHDYSCNIVTERMALGGSYNIYVFLGSVPSDSSTWFTSASFVGSQGILGDTQMPRKVGWLVSGAVSLTSALQEQVHAGKLASLAESDVTPFLKKELNWSVKMASGQVIPNNEVPGLAVSVASTRIMPALSYSGTPSFGQTTLLGGASNEATHGKAGGLQSGMPHDFWSVCKPVKA